jgi:hypothetical protein
LARAWYYTISDAISEIFTANSGAGPLMADGKNVFHTDHGNLGTAALSFDSLDSVQAAIMLQAEPGSSRHLAIPAKYLLVPVHLRTTATSYVTASTTRRQRQRCQPLVSAVRGHHRPCLD